MLPHIDSQTALDHTYLDFLKDLECSGFKGEIETQYSSRLAVATDNSIYQQLPQAAVFPRQADDLQIIGRLAQKYTGVQFSARGGGTGTNGQSLTSGIVVDVSRHMNRVIEINPEERWVRVEAGVVKDQLNDALRPYGFFFSPDLSTSNRATIGGMINTDASGQGSLVYGKTSDHVLGLRVFLADGTELNTSPVEFKSDDSQGRYGEILQQLTDTCVGNRKQILEKFPRLNRFLTGYDLEHAVSEDLNKIDVSRVIAGSEGSLCFVAEAKLNLTPIANYKALVNVKYDSFEAALRHAPAMVAANATSVETVDSNVLNLAKQDIVWHSVKDLITAVPDKDILGLNIVEYNAESREEIEQKIEQLQQSLEQQIEANSAGVIGFQVTYDKSEISKVYAMRKKAVGLLGKASDWKKPVAFAEDTAVPPENLADFIMEFRSLLDSHGLHYGMFGHVDAGVLHVRPALDLCDPEQEQLMHKISDEVVALVAKYGGLMWGEHGKGYRSEYGPAFFGDALFNELRKIKRVFDPYNQMNPGKICTPYESEAQLVKVSDEKRGTWDRQIPIEVRDSFAPTMSCNGNGLCFNYDTSSPMCPSYKVTRDRRHSPKGRAGMLREWLRLLANQNLDLLALEKRSTSFITRVKNSFGTKKQNDFSREVFEVMEHCLACKACTNQCPINVDIPTYRARFLSLYYQRYTRPLKDLLVANIEKIAPVVSHIPRLHNFVLGSLPVKSLLSKFVGYVDSPLLSVPQIKQREVAKKAVPFDFETLSKLTDEERAKTVIFVLDPFTGFYEADLVEDAMQLVTKLGFTPVLLPFVPNGKPQHVKGFLKQFEKTAKNASEFLNKVSELNLPMLGLDASLVLCYRDEYKTVLGENRGDFEVLLMHEWLSAIEHKHQVTSKDKFALFSHCTEKTMLPTSEKQWQTIYASFGLDLEPVAVGCCGMAGTFGHEKKHLKESTDLFQLSWSGAMEKQTSERKVLATGYSCRSQVKRIEQYKPLHPVQALNRSLQ